MIPPQILVVTLPWACFRLDVAEDRVIAAAPIARWCVGKRLADCTAYWQRRGATVHLIDLTPSPE